MAMDIQVYYDEEQSVSHMALRGEVDIYTSSELKAQLQRLSKDHPDKDIRIDMSQLDYIDSTGLGVLIGALKILRPNQRNIYLINPKNNVRKVLKITNLDQIFQVEGDLHDEP